MGERKCTQLRTSQRVEERMTDGEEERIQPGRIGVGSSTARGSILRRANRGGNQGHLRPLEPTTPQPAERHQECSCSDGARPEPRTDGEFIVIAPEEIRSLATKVLQAGATYGKSMKSVDRDTLRREMLTANGKSA